MANATGTPQSALYQARGEMSDGNSLRNRSMEQQHSYNSGNPMNYTQYMNGQDPSLARYVPPMLNSTSPTSPSWQNNNMQGGYGFNLPTAFGGFGGFSQYSQQPGGSGTDANGAAMAALGQEGGGGSFGRMAGGERSVVPPASWASRLGLRIQDNPGAPPPEMKPQQIAAPKPMQMPPTMPPVEARTRRPSYQEIIALLQRGNSGGSIAPPPPGAM